MRKKILGMGLVAGALLLVVYAQSNGMRRGGMMGEPQGQEQPVQNTNAKYKKGYEQAQITCSQCHAVPSPDKYSSSQWPSVISTMESKIQAYNKIMPSKPELQSIINYYVANSR
jgi:hypothetical protein